MTDPRLHVVDDPVEPVAALLAEAARRGETIALTGGSTVGAAYERAAALEPDWSRASVWWSDERCVPPDDERANYGLVKRTLLDPLERLPEVHRMRGEIAPAEAADEYDRALDGVRLDLLFLSIGGDGHVASLFPGSPQLAERGRRATSGPAGLDPFVDRVTLTLPTLLAGGRVVFLVTGENKAEIAARAFAGEVTPDVPSSLLRESDAPLDVYLDRAAGSALRG